MTFEMSDKARTLKIYNLRTDTQEFIGAGDCYIPAHTGLPANSTLTAPPEIPVGSVAIYSTDNDSWTLTEDHRGQTVYSASDGTSQLISSLGPLPEGTVITAPSGQYMKWDGKEWVKDADAQEAAFRAKVESQRQALLVKANSTTADWRTELQLGTITDDDKANLVEWMAYIKTLRTMDLSKIKNESDYNAYAWPETPQT